MSDFRDLTGELAQSESLIQLEDIRRLTLQPGDALVLRVSDTTSRQRAEDMLATLRQYFPGHRCFVLAPGFALEVLSEELAPAER